MAVKKQKHIAVTGAGYWGKNLVRNFYELGVLKIVCDQNKQTLKKIKQKYPEIQTTESLKNILDDKQIKGIVIATPAVDHYKITKMCLLKNKDVFVEKPLALNLKQAEELVSLGKQKKRILMVGHILHYHPAIIRLKQLIKANSLGKIQYIYSNRLNFGKLRTEENILWSFAPHDISIIIALLSKLPKSVHAHGMAWLNKNVVDSTLTYFKFSRNLVAHIFVNWLNPFKEQKLAVIGSKKMAVFDDQIEDKLVIYPHKVKWHIGKIPEAKKAKGQIIKLAQIEPLRKECQYFLNCIKTRKKPKTDGTEALKVLKILIACEKSLNANGKLINIK